MNKKEFLAEIAQLAARMKEQAEHYERGQAVANAVKVIEQFGSIDGAAHKQWVIDQVMRMLLDDEYDAWVASRNADKDYEPWDVRIAP